MLSVPEEDPSLFTHNSVSSTHTSDSDNQKSDPLVAIISKMTKIAATADTFFSQQHHQLMPVLIHSAVQESSLYVIHQQARFDHTYFRFLCNLMYDETDHVIAAAIVRLVGSFIFNTYFHAHESLRIYSLEGLRNTIKNSCLAAISFGELLCENPSWLTQCLLECPIELVRIAVYELIVETFSALHSMMISLRVPAAIYKDISLEQVL